MGVNSLRDSRAFQIMSLVMEKLSPRCDRFLIHNASPPLQFKENRSIEEQDPRKVGGMAGHRIAALPCEFSALIATSPKPGSPLATPSVRKITINAMRNKLQTTHCLQFAEIVGFASGHPTAWLRSRPGGRFVWHATCVHRKTIKLKQNIQENDHLRGTECTKTKHVLRK